VALVGTPVTRPWLNSPVTGTEPRVALTAVVFTDLVNSTAIRVALGESRADQLRREHDEALGRVTESCGGRVVKSTGDGVMAAFGSAYDAVRAAVGMQQAVHDLASVWSEVESLAIRVGVSVGDVSVEEDDCFGTPVVEAARLEAQAAAGEILCSELVRALAGSRAAVSYQPVGALELKGLAAPLQAWRIEWAPAAGHGVAFPASLSLSRPDEFVDRLAEVDALLVAADEAGRGRRSLVLVGGEPGVGKTWLVSEAAARLHAQGAIVLAGGCSAFGAHPFQPFVELFGQWAASVPADEVRQVAGDDLAIVAALVPALAHQLEGGVAPRAVGDDPLTILDAVGAVLDSLADRAPLVVVLDDLQWADPASVRLIAHLVHAPRPTRLLVVGTYRDTEVTGQPFQQLLEGLAGRDGVHQLRLEGLDRDAVADVLGAAGLPRALATLLHDETDGNALFVREVRLRLGELGEVSEHTDLTDIGVPDGVRAVIRQRLRRLDPSTAELLVTAAVIGPSFELDVLDAATGADRDVLAALEDATAARLVDEQGAGRFRFTHALVHEALLGEVLASRRARLHRQIAEAIERTPGEATPTRIGQLAHHWLAAGGDDGRSRGVGYSIRAGDAACAVLALDDADAYFHQALSVLGDSGDRRQWCDAMLGLAEVDRRRGDSDRAIASFRQVASTARALGDAERLARAATGTSSWWVALSADKERSGPLLREALDALAPDDSPARARVLAALQHCVADPDEAVALGDEAVAVARRSGDLSALAFACHARHAGLNARVPDTLEESLRFASEVEAASLAAGEWELVGASCFSFMFPHAWQGDLTAVDHDNSRLAEFSRPRRWSYGIGWSLLIDGGASLRDGDPHRAEELANEAVTVGGAFGVVQLMYAAVLFDIRHQQGRLDELAPLFDALLAEHPGDPELLNHRALLAVETQPPEQARDAVDTALATRLGRHDLDGDGGFWLAHLAEPATRLARDETVRALRDRLLRYEPLWQHQTCTLWLGPTDLPLAMLSRRLGDLDDASARIDRAIAALEPTGALLLLAQARLERDRIRAARGQTAAARDDLDLLVPVCREHGLRRLELGAQDLLDSLG